MRMLTDVLDECRRENERLRVEIAALSRGGSSTGETPEIAQYLKDGETVAECIARNRTDVDTALGLLARERRRAEAATDALRLADEAFDAHSLWCGHKTNPGSPGDPSYRVAREAITAALSAPSSRSPSTGAGTVGEKIEKFYQSARKLERLSFGAPSSQAPLPADYETNPRACRQCGLSLAACFRWRGGQTHQPCCDACDHDAMPSSQATPLIEGDR